MIKKYIPVVRAISDNRKPEGGYYEATCDVCGTLFYPKRSNALYCNPNCAVGASRKAKAEVLAGGGIIKAPKKTKINKKNPIKTDKALKHGNSELIGYKSVINFIKAEFSDFTKEEEVVSLTELKKIAVGEVYFFGNTDKDNNQIPEQTFEFERLSEEKWYILKKK